MSTAIRPAFNKRRVVADSASARELDLQRVRFLFAPLLHVDTRYDLAGFDSIQPGAITIVDAYRYPIANTKRIQEGVESAEPEQVQHERKPGIIARRTLGNNVEDDGVATGFCELVELAGLDPNRNDADRALIDNIQAVLWPVSYETGKEQMAAVMGADIADRPEIFGQIQARLVQAVETTMAYCDVKYLELVDELSQRAAGGEGAKGRRNKVDNVDRRLCAYISKDVPVIASPLVQNRVREIQKQQETVAQTPALAQVQCEACGAMANLIVATGLPPKLCAGCGNEFGATGVTEETPLERKQREMKERRSA